MALGAAGLCMGCELRADERKNGAARLERRLVEMMGLRGAEEFTFERFRQSPGTAAAYGAARNFNPLAENLYLCGAAGTGKTHLAGSVTRAWLTARGAAAVEFHKVPRLLRWFHLRKPSEYDEEIERLAKLHVLVLDDLGVEKSSEYNLGTLYEIIDARYMARREGLVVTSNLAPQELAKKMDDDRFPSRLFGMCAPHEMVAPDARLDGK